MNYKKILFLFIIIILVAVGLNFFLQEKTVEAPLDPAAPETPLVGGDRDEHGCIGSAGYSWCEAKEECLRPWEEEWDESCEASLPGDVSMEGDVPGMVACTMEAKICADGSAVGRSGPDCEFEKCPEEEI
ncbi:MAG: hypothetical protein U9P50_02220 [Patescibacteria group bacterium]|nr:hypothetical protein [Patescibacteria group bacterium]